MDLDFWDLIRWILIFGIVLDKMDLDLGIVLDKMDLDLRDCFGQDGSRSLGLFWNGKTHIIAKLHRTDLVICSHSREGKTPSYSPKKYGKLLYKCFLTM